MGMSGGENLSSIASAMSRHGMEFQSFDTNELKRRYPMLHYPPSYAGLLDPKGGILRADKALAAFQVSHYLTVYYDMCLGKGTTAAKDIYPSVIFF